MNLHIDDEVGEEDIIGLIVHAYNNHLAAIAGFNEIALLHNNQEKTEELLELSLNSTKQASYLGQSLLASISRLQFELESVSIGELVNQLTTLYPAVDLSVTCDNSYKINSHTEWLIDCFNELIEFLNRLAMVQQQDSEIKITGQLNPSKVRIELLVSSKVSSLEKQHHCNLFNLYYSSKKMFGAAGVGLAKVKGFFKQTNATVEWRDGQGFKITLPTTN